MNEVKSGSRTLAPPEPALASAKNEVQTGPFFLNQAVKAGQDANQRGNQPGQAVHFPIQRKCAECAEKEAETRVQRKAIPGPGFSGNEPVQVRRKCAACEQQNQGNPAAKDSLPGSSPIRVQHTPGHQIMRQEVDPPPPETEEPAPITPESPDSGTPGPVAAIPRTMPCNPRGLSRHDFLAQNGNDQTEFGKTTLHVLRSMFDPGNLSFRPGSSGRRVKLAPIRATIPAVDSIYTQAGNFTEGSFHYDGDSSCAAGTYPKRWRIYSGGAAKIRAGEQEHCDDYNLAYQNSVLPYIDTVNQWAGAEREFASEAAARRALRRSLGFDPDGWFERFDCLSRKSLTRDQLHRGDARDWHTPIERMQPPNPRESCRYIDSPINESSFPQIGAHPSSSIITADGC